MPNSRYELSLEHPGHRGSDVKNGFDGGGLTKTAAAKYVQPTTADPLPVGKEKAQETWKTGSSSSAATAASPCYKDIPNMKLAKKAVAFAFDIDEDIIQLIIDADRLQLDPSLTFNSSSSLSTVAQDVASSLQRLEELRAKVSHAQQQLQQQQREKKEEGVEVDGEAATSGAKQFVETGIQKKQCCGAAGAEHTKDKCLPAGMPEASEAFPSTSTSTSVRSSSSSSLSPSSAGSQTNAAVGSDSKFKTASSVPAPAPAPTPKAELQQRLKVLSAENRKLKHRKFCRKCKKVDLADSGVTFLPCGHFITCEECSETFDDCPGCGVSIMGTVRTYLS